MIFGSKLYRTAVVRNTLAWARENIIHAPDGSVFLADSVEQAQGRQGRAWQIAPGQLLFTAVLKPALLKHCDTDDQAIRLNQLSMALSLGILQPIKHYGVSLKWPNDFIINEKKVCGMLMQAVWEKNNLVGIILGFGLNINNSFLQDHELFEKATSLSMIAGQPLAMRALYKELLASLDEWYLLWQKEEFLTIYKAWKAEQILFKKAITIHQKDSTLLSGQLSQLLPNGDAIILTHSGHLKTVPFCNVEEVSYEK